MPPLLELDAIDAAYGDLQALRGVSLSLQAGEVLALVGANGAGKTTLLRCVCGLMRPRAGSVRLAGETLSGQRAERIAAAGVAMVPEGRQLFPSLSVEENLQMGAVVGRRGAWNLQAIYGLFPILREFRQRPATLLSGGQQQMVAIGRALMANPRLLLCDELSLGLAPLVVDEIYRAFARIRGDGLAIVLVEQDVARACACADHLVCLLQGRVTLRDAANRPTPQQIAAAYFGE